MEQTVGKMENSECMMGRGDTLEREDREMLGNR
jgi:hypothetical protein